MRSSVPGVRERQRVLLLSLPVSSPYYPSIGLSLLKAALQRQGVHCDVRYPHLEYAERVGTEAYELLIDASYYGALLGEWVFSAAAHDQESTSGLDYCTDVLARDFGEHFPVARLMNVLAARENAAAFINACFDSIPWNDYAIVGFTSSFQQTMASLALARRIKQSHPDILIVFGGANCEGEMGIELHRRYSFVDIVCSGEGDRAFPALVRRFLDGESYVGLPGLIVRDGAETAVPAVLADPVRDMDSLPYPDFTDFFEQHAKLPEVHRRYPPVPMFETARGCWWGAKHHCKFCGLNGQTMAFRSKSQARAHGELIDLVCVDNILDMTYFKELLPRIAAGKRRIVMHVETKSNLRRDQIELMARAGLRKIQPGIESLDSEVLRLMDKGCTMLQNVQTLRLAAESGVYVEWNFLYGFPGEEPRHYDAMERIVPTLRHLHPPGAWARVRPDRFSPYFNDPAAFGVDIAAAPAYPYVFPFAADSVRRLAYHFAMTNAALAEAQTYTAGLAREIDLWTRHQAESELYVTEAAGDLVV